MSHPGLTVRGAALAKLLVLRIDNAEDAAKFAADLPANQFRQDDPTTANAKTDDLGRQSWSTIREVASQLSPKWYLTAGIFAYFLGAIFGLVASIGALNN